MTRPRVSSPAPAEGREQRWQLIRDVLIFQAKMLLEGVRDLLLVPFTFAAGVIGVAVGGERPERLFHDVLRAGHRFDAWLNLFGAVDEAERRRLEARNAPEGIDQYFQAIEERIVDQHGRGGLTQSARKTIDDWLDTIQQAARKKL